MLTPCARQTDKYSRQSPRWTLADPDPPPVSRWSLWWRSARTGCYGTCLPRSNSGTECRRRIGGWRSTSQRWTISSRLKFPLGRYLQQYMGKVHYNNRMRENLLHLSIRSYDAMTVNMLVPVEATEVVPATAPHNVCAKYIKMIEWRENLLTSIYT